MRTRYLLMVLAVSVAGPMDIGSGAYKDISESRNLLQGKTVITTCPFNDGGIGSINDGFGNFDIIGDGNYDWDADNVTVITGFGGTSGSDIGTIRVWYEPFNGGRPFTGFRFKSSTVDLTSESVAYRTNAANYETELGTYNLDTSDAPALPAGWTTVDATGYEVTPLYYYDIPVNAPVGTKSLWFHYLDGTTPYCPLLREIQAFPPPVLIDNSGGATNVTSTNAWLNGNLIRKGDTNCTVRIYWGTSDGTTNFNNWAATNVIGTNMDTGTFTTNVTGLFPDTLYFYRCYATNSMTQSAWAVTSATFLTGHGPGTGNVWIVATDPSAREADGDPGVFTIYRPNLASATSGALRINYAISGNANNGEDYVAIATSVVMAAGAYATNITITPYDDVVLEGTETVTVTLASGPYVILAATNTANVTIEDNTNPSLHWPYSMRIQTVGYTAAGSLTNFPVLVTLSNNIGNSGFSYTGFASAIAGDLRFANSNLSASLDYEIEEWDTNGASYIWVKLSYVVDTNTYFWAYWGNTNATAAPLCWSNGATWSDGYRAVWHVNDVNGAGKYPDATSNANDGVLYGVGAYPGRITNGVNCYNDQSYVDCGTSASLNLGYDRTFSAWVECLYFESDPYVFAGIVFRDNSARNGGWDYLMCLEPNGRLTAYDGTDWDAKTDTGVMTLSTWYHVAFVTTTNAGDTNSTIMFYVNGELKGSNTTFAYNETAGNHVGIGDWYSGVGGHPAHSIIDQVEISAVARGGNWIWACWSNQCGNSTFLWYGTVTVAAASSPVALDNASGATSINGSNGTAYLFGDLVSDGGASATVWIYWGCNDGGTNKGSWGTNTSVGIRSAGLFSNQVSGLAADRVYYYRCYASNANSDAWAPDTSVWMAQTRNLGGWHLVSVPIDFGSGSNRLNSTLGTNLMTGLQSGVSDGASDNIWYLASGGSTWWRNWYAAGGWQTSGVQSALEIKVGEAFWVKRYTTGATVDYAMLAGPKPTNSAAITLLSSNWVTFGGPYEEAATTNGAGTTNVGWGFAARGGVRGHGARQADKIYAKYGGKWYELYLGMNSNWYDGVSGQQTTIKLQPGGGYYYFHRGDSPKSWSTPRY